MKGEEKVGERVKGGLSKPLVGGGGGGGRQMATSPLWVFSLLKNYKG